MYCYRSLNVMYQTGECVKWGPEGVAGLGGRVDGRGRGRMGLEKWVLWGGMGWWGGWASRVVLRACHTCTGEVSMRNWKGGWVRQGWFHAVEWGGEGTEESCALGIVCDGCTGKV